VKPPPIPAPGSELKSDGYNSGTSRRPRSHQSMIATALVHPAEARSILTWEARHHEARRGQEFEIVQLFDMTVADVPPGLVAFPDQAGVSWFQRISSR